MKMLEHALFLAQRGFCLLPLYEPVLDEQGKVTGCSCRKKGGCTSIGKHPRLKGWRENSTTDEKQIREWWGRWPNANIGIDCGKSGLLVLDHDSYKDTYSGDKLEIDEETVTVLTGGGGTHLWYRMPAGKRYRNNSGDLPAGIDVRGDGGYVVAPPSVHESGRCYQFEFEYGLEEIEIKALPRELQNILDAAQPRAPLPEVHITKPSDTAPNLAQWTLPDRILSLIHHPKPKGQRSEADMSVCVAFCSAGATDDEIHSVFAHYPIGVDGKFGERGVSYLQLTLSKARQYVASQSRLDPDEIKELRLWVKTVSFRDRVPKEMQCKAGYRTDSTDTKLADALLDVAEKYNSWVFRVGLKPLRDQAGLGSTSTVRKALKRLEGWFIEVVELSDGRTSAKYRIMADVVVRSHPITGSSTTVIGCDLTTTTYSSHKAEDAFLLGRSRTAKRADLGLRSLSEPLLRVMDALEQHGAVACDECEAMALDRKELSRITGKTLNSIKTATRVGVDFGILFEHQEKKNSPKEYMLSPWAWQLIDEIVPQMKTHKLRIERKDREYENIQRHCEDRIRLTDEGKLQMRHEERSRLERRRQWAIERRMECVPEIFPDWSQEEVECHVTALAPFNMNDPLVKGLAESPVRVAHARTEQGRKAGREQYVREHEALLLEAEEQMVQQGLPRKKWRRYLLHLGYTSSEARLIVAGVWDSARRKQGLLHTPAEP